MIDVYGSWISQCVPSVSAAILMVVLARAVSAGNVPSRLRYFMWGVPLFGLLISAPFPLASSLWDEVLLRYGNFLSPGENTGLFSRTAALISSTAVPFFPERDFAVSALASPDSLHSLYSIALAGTFVFAAYAFIQQFLTVRAVRALPSVKDSSILEILSTRAEELGIRRTIPIKESRAAATPFLSGILFPVIVLPARRPPARNRIDDIILHELIHLKHGDNLVLLLFTLARAVLWFNPLVWIAFRMIRQDQELACDDKVLSLLSRRRRIGYGKTILAFAGSNVRSSTGVSFLSEKRSLFQRIRNIAFFPGGKTSPPSARIAFAAFICVSAVLVAVPGRTASSYADAPEKTAPLQMGAVNDAEISAVLYNPRSGIFKLYNRKESLRRRVPYSTYKIYGALNALESGALKSPYEVKKWDGRVSQYEEWNRDQNLKSAMRNSVNWFFSDLSRKAGKQVREDFVREIHYGNQRISSNDEFWSDGSLEISLVEQVRLLERFNTDRLSSRPDHIAAVKHSIMIKPFSGSTLYGKTGTGILPAGTREGLFVGFLENGNRTYYTAVWIRSGKDAGGRQAMRIAEAILKKELSAQTSGSMFRCPGSGPAI